MLVLWSVVHGFAPLVIAGRFDPLLHEQGIDAFVARRRIPVLDAALRGSVPVTPERARRAT